MEFLDLFVETASSNNAEIRLIQICCSSNFGTRNLGKRMEIEVADHIVDEICHQVHDESSKKNDRCRVSLKSQHL